MMKNCPLVSVIIPVYNSEKYLAETLDSVFAQTYRPSEVIVVDTSSIDLCADIVRSYPEVRYLHQADRGMSVALNTGIAVAQGELIAFLDTDNKWPINTLQIQLSYLESNPQVDIIQGMVQDIDLAQVEGDDRISEDKLVSGKLLNESYYNLNLESAIYRKSTFDKVGLFDEKLKYNEDIDWFVRAWDCKIITLKIDEVTVFRHKHQSNARAEKDLMRTIYRKRTIDRLRQKYELNFSPDLANINRYIALDNAQNLQNFDFSIISNDCWGGFVYESLGTIYTSPFIGTRIIKRCYLKLLKNLKEYLQSPLEFSNCSRYESVNLELKERYFPIGVLNNGQEDIEIHFYHESNEEEAKNKWERRAKRIQWNNIFVKFSDYWEEDFSLFLKEFESLRFPYKICFTSKPYPDFPSAFFIPGFERKDADKLVPVYQEYFDIIAWLNKSHGNNINSCRIKNESE